MATLGATKLTTSGAHYDAGAALGSAFGGIAQVTLGPTGLAVAAPAAYALVGVAGMLAANCQVPLTAVLLLFELTHDYFIIVRPSSLLVIQVQQPISNPDCAVGSMHYVPPLHCR